MLDAEVTGVMQGDAGDNGGVELSGHAVCLAGSVGLCVPLGCQVMGLGTWNNSHARCRASMLKVPS